MAGSTFNLRGCSSTGGTAGGGGACGINVSVPSEFSDAETSATEIASRATTLLRESIAKEIREHLLVNGVNSKRIAFETTLTYDCPKVGDVVRWDKVTNRYDKAYASYDLTPNIHDREHLTEVIGVVERVETSCDGSVHGSVPSSAGLATNATIVMFGEIVFEGVDLENNPLVPGTTYYLWDNTYHGDVAFGSNLSKEEPTISKPVLLATSTSRALVTHYRPMTGSSSGGQTEREDYVITPTLQRGGWSVTVENIGKMASVHELIAEIHYDRLDGSPSHIMHKTLGSLRSKPQAIVLGDTSNSITFDATTDSIDFGKNHGSNEQKVRGINGVGEITVKVKTSNGVNYNRNTVLNTVEFASSATVRSIPNLQINSRCADQNQPDIADLPVGLDIDEGVMYEIRLIDGVGGADNETPLGFEIDMPGELYVEMEWPNEEDPTNPNTASTQFSLPSDDQTAVEVFPSNDLGGGITEKNVTLKLKTSTGDLPENHWAQYLASSSNTAYCGELTCCSTLSGKAIVQSNSGAMVSISELLGGIDTSLINNPSGAKLYTMSDGSNIVWPTGQKPTDSLEVSWKNVREDVQICYDANIKSGTEPAFMTIYANEARTSIKGQTMDQHDYDPRYILAEVGAQETLNGETIKLTLNYGTSRTECCLAITFNGSLEGTHYTIQELCDAGLLSNSSLGCPQSCG